MKYTVEVEAARDHTSTGPYDYHDVFVSAEGDPPGHVRESAGPCTTNASVRVSASQCLRNAMLKEWPRE